MTARDLRIGDAERDAAATELGEHFAQGRLDSEEYAGRLDTVMGARTAGDLVPAFVDLPRVGGMTLGLQGDGAGTSARRTGRMPQLPRLGVPLTLLLVVLGVILVVTHLPLLVIGLLVYVLAVRRLRHRGGRGRRGSWHGSGQSAHWH